MMSQTVLMIKPMDETIAEYYKNHSHYHDGDSGIDLYIPEDIEIGVGETKIVDLGIQCEMICIGGECPLNISYYLYPRSSISKTPLIMANSVGIIDAGYRGNIKVALKYVPNMNILEDLILNNNEKSLEKYSYIIKKGTRLVQICSPNLSPISLEIVNNLSETTRGTGGFGSTGI